MCTHCESQLLEPELFDGLFNQRVCVVPGKFRCPSGLFVEVTAVHENFIYIRVGEYQGGVVAIRPQTAVVLARFFAKLAEALA